MHPEANYLITCLKSDNDVMLQAWQNGTKTVTKDLIEETLLSFYIRILKNDEGSAWCLRMLTDLYPEARMNQAGDTPMIIVARQCSNSFIAQHFSDIEALAKKSESILLTNEEGETSLMVAAEEGKYDLVSLLLRAGADISHLSVLNETVIDKAKKSANVDKVIDVLVDWITTHNVSSDVIERELRELFYDALVGGQDHLIEKLRPFSDDLREEMIRSITEGREDVMLRLIELGVDLYGKTDDGLTWKDLARKQRRGRLIGLLSMAEM